jgi:acetyl-CoA decarbonylase/synthase, CODH/ACS complex subunit gamma
MALTGIQIFKLLPKTNCKECGYPTCLAFAMALASGKAELDKCRTISDEARADLSDASAPPIRQLTIGTGEYETKIGGETVLFRHEKTFFNKPGIAVLVSTAMTDEEIDKKLASLAELQYERVGEILRAEMVAVKDAGGDPSRFSAVARKASDKGFALVLMSKDASAMREALQAMKGKRPLIYAATNENADIFATLAKEFSCPLAVHGKDLEDVSALTERLTALGLKDLVIDPGSRTVRQALHDQVAIRRAALLKKSKALGFPTVAFPCEMAEGMVKETLIASMFVAKYAGIIVLSELAGETLFPLLLERLNIYTDPQRPMTTAPGIYPINNPDKNAPVLITCNFSLTYFIVSGEIESSRVPAWLCIMDTEGLSVLTAWAAGKFLGDGVGVFIKNSGVAEKIGHRRIIIPGYASPILGDLEEELPGWEVIIGPREASQIPAFLKMKA